MTHSELVEIAGKWLRNTAGCKVVMTELVALCPNGEIPDAIGWRGTDAIVVECKTSRSDFLADRSKRFRRNPELGMGALRYFLAPAGIIKPEELPARWGLLEITGSRVRRLVGAEPRQWSTRCGDFWHAERSRESEAAMLLSAMNRLRIRLGDRDFRHLTHQTFTERKQELAEREELEGV